MTMPQFRTRMESVLNDPGFRTHLIVYVAVNLLLIVIDVATSPQSLWFFWPLLGWGLGLLAHGFAVYQKTRPQSTKT